MIKVSSSLVIASASATLSCFVIFLVTPVLRAKNRRLLSNSRGGSCRDLGKETQGADGVDIYCSATPRNKKILSDAVDLSSVEPWGYSNCHFASILAQLRPSPFIMQWGNATRKVS